MSDSTQWQSNAAARFGSDEPFASSDSALDTTARPESIQPRCAGTNLSKSFRRAALVGIVTLMPFLMGPSARAYAETVIASDNFNRPNQTPFAVGGNWGRVIAGNYDGVSGLTNNQVTSVSNEGIYYWKGAGTFNPARQFARQRVVDKNGEIGLVLLGGPDHAINIGWGPPGVNSTVYIYWYKNGADQAVLGTGPSTLVNGDIIEAVLDGGVIYAKVNGVTVKSVANTTTLTTGTPGFITYLNPSLPSFVGILDDWVAGTPADYSISGVITENATGLSGVLVTASGGITGSTTTNGSGAYTITGVPSGATSVLLTPTLSGHAMSPLNKTVLGPVNADVTGQNFTSTPNTGATLITLADHGSVTRDPDLSSYPFGTDVTLTPVPDGGYEFASWSGDVPVGQEGANPLLVTMNADRTITAHFFSPNAEASDDFNRANETPLTVGGNWQKVLAGGSANLTDNQVTGASLDAVYFWQGAGTFNNARQFARTRVVSAGGQVGLVLLGSSNRAIVVAWGGGTLYIYWYSGGSYQGNLTTASSTLQDGDEIEAVLDQGKIYAKRNGVVVTSVNNTTSLPSGTPGFETYQTGGIIDDWEAGTPPAYTMSGTITENAAGLSGVLVTASGGFSGSATTNINGHYTIAGVPAGVSSVVLTPTLFGHAMSPPNRTVTGPLTGNVTGQDFTGTVDTDSTLTIFAPHGSVTKTPDLPVYPIGSIVTLTPVPDPGYGFASWGGDVPTEDQADNPLFVAMDRDRTITANLLGPGVVTADYFDRPNETPLLVGGNWQRVLTSGAANLTSSRVVGGSGDALYYWQGAGTFDAAKQFARVRVVSAGGQVGLVLYGGSSQAIVVAWNAGTLFIYWYSGGSYQGNLTTAGSTLLPGDVIEAVLEGGAIYAKRNGAVITSVANTTTLTSGRPGFETYLTGGALDDWEGGPAPCELEVCDNRDNDCDGAVDEGDPGGGAACVTALPSVCTAGTLHCTGGTVTCQPNVGPSPETCNGLDDDCDGAVDEGGALCNDGNACTVDVCQAGVCVGTPLNCNDGNPCTTDSCNAGTGCVATNHTNTCDDGNACTTGDACAGGICVGVAVPPPAEVQGVRVEQRHPTKMSWTGMGALAYDIASGTVSSLRSNGTAAASCLSNDRGSPSLVDNRADPAAGNGYYYLVRAQSACGVGTFGIASAGQRQLSQVCP